MSSIPSKIRLVRNPNYTKSGRKSYVSLMAKYHFNPTMPGPYFLSNGSASSSKMGQSRFATPAKVMRYLDKSGHLFSGLDETGQRYIYKDPASAVKTADAGLAKSEDIQFDLMYLTPVEIGTPPQKLRLNFDTGSADLWVWSTSLPDSIRRSSTTDHESYDPAKSSTFRSLEDSSWNITYGDGSSASGVVGTDVVRVGNLEVADQAIELATDVSNQFSSMTGDGLLGLAWEKINTVKPEPVPTFMSNLCQQSKVDGDSKVFTAYLGSWKDADEIDKGESFYTFGFIEPNVLEACESKEPHYTPVDDSLGFWQIDSTAATVNGETIERNGNSSIMDTGTTLALIDDEFCEAIYSKIQGAQYDFANQGWVFPADTPEDQIPEIEIDIGGKLFPMQKEDLFYAYAGRGMVYGGFQSRGNMPMDIYGGTVLKSIYAIFDYGNKRFGCVSRPESTQNLEVPAMEGE